MKKIIISLVLALMLVGLTGCTDSMSETERRFKQAYKEHNANYSWEVIYDTETKVMYLHDDMYKCGGLTVLVDQDGTPLLYGGE